MSAPPVYLFLTLWLCSIDFAANELFTAMADFEETLIEEQVVVDSIMQYVKGREERLDMLRSLSEEYKNNAKQLSNDMKLFWHPLTIFHLIRKLTDGWDYIKAIMMDKGDAEDAIANITAHRSQEGIQFPTEEDVTGAALGLFRLQDTYALEPRAIADGFINGAKLRASECLDLGIMALSLKERDSYHSLLWLREAYDRFKTRRDQNVSEEEILDYLSYAMYLQNNLEWAAFLIQRLKLLDPFYPNLQENLAYYTRELEQKGIDVSTLNENNIPAVQTTRPLRREGNEGYLIYESLCRGENNKKPTKYLHCYYKMNRPFLRLAPLKVEVIHRKPLLLLFRDIVSPKESLRIRQLGAPKLARAMISNIDGELEPASYRISKSGWLDDNEGEVIGTLSKRIEDMTDLTTKTGEALQVANYGIGGHYDSHYDFAQKHEKNAFKNVGAGNRIATVLFYLTKPTSGGATVFPKLRLTLYPTLNDAVVWYNLARSGDGDQKLLHAACPVLSGIKWVANKWLHEHGQEFLRPCALNEHRYD